MPARVSANSVRRFNLARRTKWLWLCRFASLIVLLAGTALSACAQNLSVSPTSIWVGGYCQVVLKAISWTDEFTGQTVSAGNAPHDVSGHYNYPGFNAGGMTCYTNLSDVPGEMHMTLTSSAAGSYAITSDAETVTVTVVDLNDMQKDAADPIKIGTTVTFTLTTTPGGATAPSSLIWYGEVSGSGLSATSAWTHGGNKTVTASSDCGSELGWVGKTMSVDVFELVGISLDNEYPDVNEQVTWTASLIPYENGSVITWSTNGVDDGTGMTYRKSFPKEAYGGSLTVKATCGSSNFDKKVWLERVEIVFTNSTTAQFVGGPSWHLSLTNSSSEVTWLISGPTGSETRTGTDIDLVPGTEPGQITVQVYPDRVPSRQATKELWAVRLTVSGASLIDNGGFAKVLTDNGDLVDPPYLWTQSTDTNTAIWPVQYQRNTLIKVKSAFAVEPSAWAGTVKVKAEGEYELEKKDFNASGGLLEADSVEAKAGSTLPNQVDWKSNFTLTWKCSVDGGNHFGDAQTSRQACYVTLNKPDDQRRTVVHLACKNTGATSDATAVDNVWASFAGPANCQSWDGNPLCYYQGGSVPQGGGSSPAPWQLVLGGNADCDSWADFLVQCLQVHKLSGSAKRLMPNAATIAKPDMIISIPIPTAYTNPSSGEVFSLTAPTGAYWKATQMIEINCLGAPGQNVSSPAHEFNYHAITTIDVAGYQSRIYDPSYGKMYNGSTLDDSRKMWENDALWQMIWKVVLMDPATGSPATLDAVGTSGATGTISPYIDRSAQRPDKSADNTVF